MPTKNFQILFISNLYIYIKGSGVSAFYHINPLATHVTH